MTPPYRVVLLGAGGFIGNALIQSLCSSNILISAVSRSYWNNLDAYSTENLDIITSDLSLDICVIINLFSFTYSLSFSCVPDLG